MNEGKIYNLAVGMVNKASNWVVDIEVDSNFSTMDSLENKWVSCSRKMGLIVGSLWECSVSRNNDFSYKLKKKNYYKKEYLFI